MGNAIVTQRDTQLEKQRAGYIKLSLTNFTTSAEPTIAAGSVVEISGSLYSFTTNESITGWASVGVGDAYIKLVPDGTNPCTAEFTATAPTWSDAKQGWYDATGTDRYVAGLYKTSATEYDRKHVFVDRDVPTLQGDNTFSGKNTFTDTIGYKHQYTNTSFTESTLFSALDSWIPTSAKYLPCTGVVNSTSLGILVGGIIGLFRVNATTINLRYLNSSTVATETLTSTGTDTFDRISIFSNFDEM